MPEARILWADDEIDLLKPHILFLKSKGYDIDSCNSGGEAIDKCKDAAYDIVFLDEHMPGISGLEALKSIKTLKPNLPVVMITKSEEEFIMEEAIGSQIADYLIKPVNPHQILLSIKKILESKRLFTEKATSDYGRAFGEISMNLNSNRDADDWAQSYLQLVNWDLKLQDASEGGMAEVFEAQKGEANEQFCRFVGKNYSDWLNHTDEDSPILSHRVIQEKLLPVIKNRKGKSVFFIVIDNLRMDQHHTLDALISEYYRAEEQSHYYSILPTSTEFARNSLFAGLLPTEIKKKYPKQWDLDWGDEGSRNQNEEFYFNEAMKRYGIQLKTSYTKILSLQFAHSVVNNFSNLLQNDLNVIVYNFVDMLSHARSEMRMIKELAENEKAYRSLTKSWFENSPLLEIIKKAAESDCQLVITTDHGSIRVKDPVRILGDRNTTTNLRYKDGKNLNYNNKNVMGVENPKDVFLPAPFLSASYAFATTDQFFVYPKNFNHFVNLYTDTFQHGGISMEEVIVPFAVYSPKK